jgi:hypothetical protein
MYITHVSYVSHAVVLCVWHTQKRDVVVYRLITCGTVEEKIYRKQVCVCVCWGWRGACTCATTSCCRKCSVLFDMCGWDPLHLVVEMMSPVSDLMLFAGTGVQGRVEPYWHRGGHSVQVGALWHLVCSTYAYAYAAYCVVAADHGCPCARHVTAPALLAARSLHTCIPEPL